MSFYPPEISEKIYAPRNVGETAEANAFGTQVTFVCGAVMRFTLRIDKQTKEISEAKFKTSGCGFSVAAAESLARAINGKKLPELNELEKYLPNTESATKDFSNDRGHCFELALKAVQAAFANFRAAQIEEFTGEKALICTCFGVSEETIENLVENKSLDSVEEVTAACHAGGGCGSCQPLIQEIIDTIQREEF